MARSAVLNFAIAASADPAWYTALANSTWMVFSGGPAPTLQSVGAESVGSVSAWTSSSASTSTLLHGAQGGHGDGSWNAMCEYDFNRAVPQWFLRVAASTVRPQNVDYYTDGKPSARHSYSHITYIQPLLANANGAASSNGDRWFTMCCFAPWGNGFDGASLRCASYSRANVAYDPANFFPDWPTDCAANSTYRAWCAFDPVGEKVYASGGYAGNMDLSSLNPRTKVWTWHGGKTNPLVDQTGVSGFVDPVRRVFVGMSDNRLYVYDINNTAADMKSYLVSGMSSTIAGPGFRYEPVSGKWVYWTGGKTLQVINPPTNYRTGAGAPSDPLNGSAVYSVTQTITPSTGVTPTVAPVASGGSFAEGKFNYIAQPRGFCVFNQWDEPMYFFKLPTSGL